MAWLLEDKKEREALTEKRVFTFMKEVIWKVQRDSNREKPTSSNKV